MAELIQQPQQAEIDIIKFQDFSGGVVSDYVSSPDKYFETMHNLFIEFRTNKIKSRYGLSFLGGQLNPDFKIVKLINQQDDRHLFAITENGEIYRYIEPENRWERIQHRHIRSIDTGRIITGPGRIRPVPIPITDPPPPEMGDGFRPLPINGGQNPAALAQMLTNGLFSHGGHIYIYGSPRISLRGTTLLFSRVLPFYRVSTTTGNLEGIGGLFNLTDAENDLIGPEDGMFVSQNNIVYTIPSASFCLLKDENPCQFSARGLASINMSTGVVTSLVKSFPLLADRQRVVHDRIVNLASPTVLFYKNGTFKIGSGKSQGGFVTGNYGVIDVDITTGLFARDENNQRKIVQFSGTFINAGDSVVYHQGQIYAFSYGDNNTLVIKRGNTETGVIQDLDPITHIRGWRISRLCSHNGQLYCIAHISNFTPGLYRIDLTEKSITKIGTDDAMNILNIDWSGILVDS